MGGERSQQGRPGCLHGWVGPPVASQGWDEGKASEALTVGTKFKKSQRNLSNQEK